LAVARDLAQFGEDAATSGLGETALALARLLDQARTGDGPLKDAAPIARELRMALAELRAITPAKPQESRVDDLRARRAARGV
jgi:hypothetical protein